MEGILIYRLVSDQGKINVSHSAIQKQVTHTVDGLTSGTKYSFSIFAVFEDVQGSGTEHTAATGVLLLFPYSVDLIDRNFFKLNSYIKSSPPLFSPVPPMVTGVKMTERTTTNVTLVWNVDKWREWTYILYFQGINVTFQANNFSLHKLSGLQPGTEYNFSVVTNFFELNSKAYEGVIVTSKKILITVQIRSVYRTRPVKGGEKNPSSAIISLLVSAIDCSGVNWHVSDSSIQGKVEGLFTNATATNKSQTHVSAGGSNVSFTGLYPGATYKISLVYEKNWNTFLQCNHTLTISE